MGKTRAGGLFYIGDTAVDCQGREIEDAPPRAPNTNPNVNASVAIGQANDERLAAVVASAVATALKEQAPVSRTRPAPSAP